MPIKLALWQGESVAGDRGRALSEIARASRAAGQMGAAAITFPELFLSGYERDDLGELAMTQDEVAGHLSPMAQRAACAICIGYPERLAEGIANSAICLGADGQVLANHRKIQLFGQTEATRFVAGDRYTTFALAGRKAAVLICYDVEFAPHIAALQGQGVDLILAPTANMRPFEHVGHHVVPTMAANHALSIVYANYCGREAHLEYFGESSITGPDGRMLARAGQHPCLLIADLPDDYEPAHLSTQSRDFRQVAP
ncbi:nitrilase [Paracoccus aurantiacus]|uniref:Nitrilase n=1 Tax=Paracoccus aurantiacus TaxID=2599412 RepID=A0A5C6S9I9_9RHOB|nr:nitrilase-related carbon-nitrogen hydrolase [Paracoccus aurantiacus]TXB71126.1 nitrilase [Paracoccus aurantiacus]